MGRVRESKKSCSVYPLKMSQPLGAVYALLGIKGCMPLMHGSQGCAAFAKTFLTRNFSENIPMQTTALSEIATVIGGDDNLHTALKTIIEKHRPELIGVVSTGVSETRGDDVEGSIKRFRELYSDYVHQGIVYVSTPDYVGSLHEGYSKALLSLVKTLVKVPYKKVPGQVNLLLSYSLNAGDVEHIKEVIESFGLRVIALPDFSSSMEGSSTGFSSITTGGTSVRDIDRMSSSSITIAIGESTREAGEYLEKKFMIPMYFFESLMGVENFDRLVKLLINLSGREPSDKLKRWRGRLLDALVDGHFYLTNKRAVVAGEPDTVYMVSEFLVKELGLEVPLVVVPTYADILQSLPVEEIVIGDLEDILLSGLDHIDLLLGNTNLRHIAKRLEAPNYRIGIPIFDRLGHFLESHTGYEGTTRLVYDIANLLMERDEEESYRVPEYIRGGAHESGFCNQESE